MTSPRWQSLDPRTPVIAGVGVATQNLDDPGSALEALELMIAAARTAGDDTGARDILRAVQRVAVPHGSWQYTDPGASSRNASALQAHRRCSSEPASRSRLC